MVENGKKSRLTSNCYQVCSKWRALGRRLGLGAHLALVPGVWGLTPGSRRSSSMDKNINHQPHDVDDDDDNVVRAGEARLTVSAWSG